MSTNPQSDFYTQMIGRANRSKQPLPREIPNQDLQYLTTYVRQLRTLKIGLDQFASAEERVDIIDWLTDGFCIHCGYRFAPDKKTCHCQNDD